MAVRTRVEPIDRDVRLIIDELLSPAAQSAQFAAAAAQFLGEADETNKSVLGRIPKSKTFVDGVQGAGLITVGPRGVIVREYELFVDVLRWIAADLIAHSPVGRSEAGDKHPGLYKASHTLFADEKEIPIGSEIPEAREFVFVNYLDYSRKLEMGSSRQFDHIYQGTAGRARTRFGNVVGIGFSYRGFIGRSSGAGTLISPLNQTPNAVRARNKRGRFTDMGGPKAHNISSKRFPVITVDVGSW